MNKLISIDKRVTSGSSTFFTIKVEPTGPFPSRYIFAQVDFEKYWLSFPENETFGFSAEEVFNFILENQ